MNAALQCIAHAPSLASHFLSKRYLQNKSNDDKLASSFAEVLHAIYQQNENPRMVRGEQMYRGLRGSSFRPRRFLEDLIEVAPQFDGGRQRKLC